MADHENQSVAPARRPWLIKQQVLYPNAYVWFVFVSAMDVFMTTIILAFGGEEVNPVANSVLFHWGIEGMIAFKFAVVVLVIMLCEIIGRKQHRTGRMVAYLAVGITAVPMLLAFLQLLVY